MFRLPDASEVGRAKDMNELEEQLQTVPAESIVFHSQSNHFSHWLMARTEFALGGQASAAKSFGFCQPRTSAPRSDRIDPRVPARTKRSADRRLSRRYFQAVGIEFSAHRFRIAGRQSSGPCLRAPPVAKKSHDAALSRRSHLRASGGRSGDRMCSINSWSRTTCSISLCIARTTPRFSRDF